MTPRPVLTIRGQKYAPTAADLLRAIESVEPGVAPGAHWVQVGGVAYPLREIARAATGHQGPMTLNHAQAFANYMGLRTGKEPGDYHPTGRPRKGATGAT